MPARSKIQDGAEVRRWLEEGWTYQEMAEEYARKYNLEISPSMFASYRSRHGLPRRIARDPSLIPWAVKAQHRWSYPLAMLRIEARRRGGFEVRASDNERLASFKRDLYAEGLVVHYDPDTEVGWWLVPRRPGVDLDMIRDPRKK